MFTLRLAWRSLWRNKRRTIITVVSIGFGLMVVIFSLGIADGIYGEMIEQIVRMQAGHVTVQHADYAAAPSVDLWIEVPEPFRSEVESWPDVERTKQMVVAGGMAKSAAGVQPAMIAGVEPSAERLTSPLAAHMTAGDYLADDDGAWAVVGGDLAELLQVEVGKKIVLTSNDAQGNLVEGLFRVKGIYETGSEEFDALLIQVPIAGARRLLNLPDHACHQFGVILRRPRDQDLVVARLDKLLAREGPANRKPRAERKAPASGTSTSDVRRSMLDVPPASAGGGRAVALTWEEVMPDFASFMKLDKGGNYVFLVLLVLLIMFTIFNTILMSVLERSREFAVLLAIGTNRWQLRRQILMESALLNLLGCVIGIVLGWVVCYWLNASDVMMSDLYGDDVTISGVTMNTAFRAAMTPRVFLWPTVLIFLSTLLLTLLPTRRAVNVKLADTLRG